MEINNILVPTDFSGYADNAFSFAIEIARTANARIFFMHSAQSIYSYSFERLIDKISSEEKLDNLVTETIVEMGDPTNSILNQLDEKDIDLIIMGSKGRSGVRKRLFGSVTMDIISKTPVPLLAIPEKSTYRGFGNIVYTTDYHTGDIEALQSLISFADLFDAELHILHVAKEMDLETEIKYRGFRELVNEQIDYPNLIFETIIEDSFYVGFANYIKKYDARLLSVTRYKKTFFQNLMEKDHTRQMGYHTQMPLLILIGEEA